MDQLLDSGEGIGECNCQCQELCDKDTDCRDDIGPRVLPDDGREPESVDRCFQRNKVVLQVCCEGSHQRVSCGKVDQECRKYQGSNQAPNCDPREHAVRHNDEHQGEHPHEDHQNSRVRIGLVRDPFDKVRTTCPPAQGEQGDKGGHLDCQRKVASAEADHHLLNRLGA